MQEDLPAERPGVQENENPAVPAAACSPPRRKRNVAGLRPNAAVLDNIAAIIEAVAIGFVPDPKPNQPADVPVVQPIKMSFILRLKLKLKNLTSNRLLMLQQFWSMNESSMPCFLPFLNQEVVDVVVPALPPVNQVVVDAVVPALPEVEAQQPLARR